DSVPTVPENRRWRPSLSAGGCPPAPAADPGVSADGPSSPCVALLPMGFAEPPGSPRALVRSYRTVSPLPVRSRVLRPGPAIAGLFSVALSCGLPRLGVTQHRARWSPDVPRAGAPKRPARGRPADSPPLLLSRSAGRAPTRIVRPAPPP